MGRSGMNSAACAYSEVRRREDGKPQAHHHLCTGILPGVLPVLLRAVHHGGFRRGPAADPHPLPESGRDLRRERKRAEDLRTAEGTGADAVSGGRGWQTDRDDSVYEEEDKTEEEGKKLEEMELAYITKKITVEGEEMSTAVDEQDYQKVLQAMKDESARDES